MKKINYLIAISLLVSLTTSCWKKSEPAKFIRPVTLSDVTSLSSYDKDFVGVVSAEQYTNFAFRVGGLINKTYVTEGAFVKKGQLMAELDPSDFVLQLESDKAQLVTTKSILDRNARLLEKQAISTQDYEIAQSNYLKAKSAYEYTKNQLEYTKLRAPFSGSIEKKFVENYQKVQPGEPIYKLINPDVLEIKFTLPESDVNILRAENKIDYFVEFDNLRGKLFSAKLKDAVDASVDGAGIPVTLSITDKSFNPQTNNVKAGFACKVKVLIDNQSFVKSFCKIPLTAIFTDAQQQGKSFVWIYEPKSSTVSRREITNAGLLGNEDVVISSGLVAGDRIVVAGVYQIVQGQKVTVLNK